MCSLRAFGMGNKRQDREARKGAKMSEFAWRDETFTIERFPRCKAYLKAMGCKFLDSNWNNYWAAVLLADAFDDGDLIEAGIDYSTMQGSKLLSILESLFSVKREKAAAKVQKMRSAELVAYLGSRGVKTSALKNDDDFVKAALILWPFIDKQIRYDQLLGQLMGMSKKTRRRANENLHNLPPDWRGAK
jgi:hypothetical protein